MVRDHFSSDDFANFHIVIVLVLLGELLNKREFRHRDVCFGEVVELVSFSKVLDSERARVQSEVRQKHAFRENGRVDLTVHPRGEVVRVELLAPVAKLLNEEVLVANKTFFANGVAEGSSESVLGEELGEPDQGLLN